MKNELTEQNGFLAAQKNDNGLIQVEETRAMQEVQLSIASAKRFPRNTTQAFSDVIETCKRKTFAEKALYAFPKGGKVIEGASIKLAQLMAQSWGNLNFGVREVSKGNGQTVGSAYAWDLQTNTLISQDFIVYHRRHTKAGAYDVTDARELDMMFLAEGSKKLRNCLLRMMPDDLVEEAVQEVKKTLTKGNKEPIQDRVKKLALAFSEFGIKVKHLEENIGHPLDSIIEDDLVKLRAIYRSIKDGFVRREEFFKIENKKEEEQEVAGEKKSDILAKKLEQKKEEPTQEEVKALSDDFFKENNGS
jgi:hypothetical protein